MTTSLVTALEYKHFQFQNNKWTPRFVIETLRYLEWMNDSKKYLLYAYHHFYSKAHWNSEKQFFLRGGEFYLQKHFSKNVRELMGILKSFFIFSGTSKFYEDHSESHDQGKLLFRNTISRPSVYLVKNFASLSTYITWSINSFLQVHNPQCM